MKLSVKPLVSGQTYCRSTKTKTINLYAASIIRSHSKRFEAISNSLFSQLKSEVPSTDTSIPIHSSTLMMNELMNSEAPFGIAPCDVECIWDSIEPEPKEKTFTSSRMMLEPMNSGAPLGTAPWDDEYLWDSIEPEPKEKTLTSSKIKVTDISTPQHTYLEKNVMLSNNEIKINIKVEPPTIKIIHPQIKNENNVTEVPTRNICTETLSIENIYPQIDDQDDQSNLKTLKDELKSKKKRKDVMLSNNEIKIDIKVEPPTIEIIHPQIKNENNVTEVPTRNICTETLSIENIYPQIDDQDEKSNLKILKDELKSKKKRKREQEISQCRYPKRKVVKILYAEESIYKDDDYSYHNSTEDSQAKYSTFGCHLPSAQKEQIMMENLQRTINSEPSHRLIITHFSEQKTEQIPKEMNSLEELPSKIVSKGPLILHMLAQTREKPFQCQICDYRCNSKTDLKRHVLTHTGEKPFQCSICDFKCIQKSALKTHIKIHTGEKPFRCSICDYSCIQKISLKTHMKNHAGEKPVQCPICNYRCTQKYTLNRHMLTHTGKKPFQCTLCDYKFNRKSHLNFHMKIHTGEKPFQCTVCDYSCIQKIALKTHMKKHV